MNEIEYVFGTGDGIVHHWSGQADLALANTGVADALWLDFDGDGNVDDALWDSDRDGVADVAALDLDDDGVLDHFFTDPTGNGTWSHQITGAPEHAEREPLPWVERDAPAETTVDAVRPASNLDLLPDIPLATVDHRTVLAQDTPGPLSPPPWPCGR
ncbi:hypothetical protein [Nocardia mangyaensis]|uniref:hypothetical protein n=1 Tax=Nocardia mangyaensis TaxID=2213200 RepID=UPI002676390A|nr:hypothetical protein [Nocardia mangyaensis]MDO3647430.1 hypothetical protein [Nocardia mangyaensis]